MSLQDLIRTAGLSRVSAEIEQVALPSVRLSTHRSNEAQLAPGCTRFGGTPDTPTDWVWPVFKGSALPFVAQLNLTEMASYIDFSPFLPDSGILTFFFDVDAFFNTGSGDAATWKVEYFEQAPPATSRYTVASEMPVPAIIYPPCPVTCTLEWTLPDYDPYSTTFLQRPGITQLLTEEEKREYYDLQSTLSGRKGLKYHRAIHRFLGHPDIIQVDMRADLGGEASDWLLLLQVDTDGTTDMDWGDTGMIYYWMRRQDALRRDFSRVQLVLQCT